MFIVELPTLGVGVLGYYLLTAHGRRQLLICLSALVAVCMRRGLDVVEEDGHARRLRICFNRANAGVRINTQRCSIEWQAHSVQREDRTTTGGSSSVSRKEL